MMHVRHSIGTIWLTVCLGLWAGAVQAQPGEARQALEQFLSGLDTYQAAFTQTLVDETGFVIQESTGVLYLGVPNRLRWELQSPMQQTLVADGHEVWLHDPELRQVTVRPMDAAMDATPLALLTQPHRLEERFAVTEQRLSDGWRLLLEPYSTQADFSEITLDLNASGELYRVQFADIFEQRTTMSLQNPQRNPPLDMDRFNFEVPEGTDIFRP